MEKKDIIPISSRSLERTIGYAVLGILLLALMYYGWTELNLEPAINSTPESIPKPLIPENCTITDDFENGNIGKIIENPPDTFTMEFGPGSGGLWFHIKLSGCKDKDLKLILKMTRDLNANSAHWYNGVNKNTPVATHDNKNWEKINSGNLNKAAKTFTFTYTPRYDFEWIAYFYPFDNWQLDEFLKNYSTNPNFNSEIIGTTPMGREQKLVTITDPRVPDDKKKVVWIISREDAWETGGTFNTIGEMKYLLSDDGLAVNLRKNVIFKFVPIVSVDGVAEGTILGIGNNANPSNIVYLTTTWMDNPSPKEIENIKNQIRKWKNSGKRIDIIGRQHSFGFQSSSSSFSASNTNFISSATKYFKRTSFSTAIYDKRYPDFVLTLYPNVIYFSSEMTAVGVTTDDIEAFGVNTIKTIADYLDITPTLTLSSASVNFFHPNMYISTEEIEAVKEKVRSKQEPWKTAYDKMISDANSALKGQIPSVTYGGKTPPGGDLHDYYSDTPYASDGVFNSNADRTDYNSAITFGKSVRNLGLAYAFTGENKYADKALEFISAWTVNSTTMMQPDFTGYQSRIELSITIPGVFYGADMIWNYPGWSPVEKAEFVSWTKKFIKSAKTWSSDNNYENWRLVFISSASVIAEDPESLGYAFERWKKIIPTQIGTEGLMVKEINRTNSLSYSLYSINGMIQTAEIARHNGVDLYNYRLQDARGLEFALDFHAPYAANPSTWPYEQITSYAGDNAALYELAYSFNQKSNYMDVINKWKRPLYEIRTMGPVTLTHAFRN